MPAAEGSEENRALFRLHVRYMDTPLGVVSTHSCLPLASPGRDLLQREAQAAPHLPGDPLSELIHPSSAPGTQCHPRHGCQQLPMSPGTAHWSCHLQENPTPNVFSQCVISVQRHRQTCACEQVTFWPKCKASCVGCIEMQ